MSQERFWLAVLIIISIGVGLTAINLGDFVTFYAAGRAALAGVNPYTVSGFFSPIYVAWGFAPLALLPMPIAFGVFAAIVFLSYGLAFYFLTQRQIRMTILLMCSPFPLLTAYYGNLEGLVLLGSILAPIVGIWLVLMKPQIGLVVAVLFVEQTWLRTRSVSRVAQVTIPVSAAFILSLIAGMWGSTPIAATWNMSLWPIGLLVGLPAAAIGLYYREMDFSLFAGPFLSPYLGGPASFAGALPLLTRRWWLAAGGVAAAWAIVIYWRMGM